eukprot:6464061-Amphidinium_carterae.2
MDMFEPIARHDGDGISAMPEPSVNSFSALENRGGHEITPLVESLGLALPSLIKRFLKLGTKSARIG